MKYIFLALFIISCVAGVFAQNVSHTINTPLQLVQNDGWDLDKWIWSQTHIQSGKHSKPILDFNAIDHWIGLGNDQDLAISQDGKYFAYTITNQPYKSNTLVVQATAGTWKQSFPGTTPVIFSGDSKQYIYQNTDKLCFLPVGTSESQCMKEVASYKQPANGKSEWLAYQLKNSAATLVLQQLTTGKKVRYDNVSGYTFDKTGEWLACQLNNEARELMILNLNTQKEQRFQSVTGYLFDASGKVLILKTVSRSNDGPVTGLQYVNLSNEKIRPIWSAVDKNSTISSYGLDASGRQLLFMVKEGSSQGDKNKQPENALWYWHAGMDKAAIRVNNHTPGIEPELLIQSATFTNNSRYIMVTLQQRPKDLPQLKPDAVKIDVWSYKDSIIQSAQLHQLNKTGKYMAVIYAEGGPLIRLQNNHEQLKIIKGDYAVIAKKGNEINGDRFWEKNYRIDSNWLISLKDGSRKLLKTAGNEYHSTFWFSPSGKYLVYFDLEQECNYFSYNLQTGKLANISANIPAWQLGTGGEFIRPGKPTERAGIAAWLQGDAGLLVYDNYDIWQLDLAGLKAPVNITNGYGRARQIRLRVANNGQSFDNNRPVLQRNDSLLLNATNLVNKQNGFYRKVLGVAGNPELLYMGPCVLQMAVQSDYDAGMIPLKAAQANTWIVKRQTTTDAPNYFLTTDFKSYSPLTNLQPQQAYNWLRSEIHSFKQLDGTMSQGILYKPENFDSTKKYPVIIGFYQQLSHRLNQYLSPNYLQSPFIEIPWLVSHEYLVFTPDIHFFSGGKYGQSALNTVDGAARYLGKLSFVDSNRMGATGHSFSGRLAYYILTHSHLFAAIGVGAGATDLISRALTLDHVNTGEGSPLENYDIPMGNIWQNKEVWLSESPVMHVDKVTSPVLMFHCKSDWGPVQAAVEMFIALRRLEKKAWWLQYDEGDHTVSEWKDLKDFTIRYTQFMDHYLKGAPAPRWMTEGIPARLKGVEAKYELDPKGNCGIDCRICQKRLSRK